MKLHWSPVRMLIDYCMLAERNVAAVFCSPSICLSSVSLKHSKFRCHRSILLGYPLIQISIAKACWTLNVDNVFGFAGLANQYCKKRAQLRTNVARSWMQKVCQIHPKVQGRVHKPSIWKTQHICRPNLHRIQQAIWAPYLQQHHRTACCHVGVVCITIVFKK